MTRLRDYFRFDEERGFARPFDPECFGDAEELQADADSPDDRIPREVWLIVLIVIAGVGLAVFTLI